MGFEKANDCFVEIDGARPVAANIRATLREDDFWVSRGLDIGDSGMAAAAEFADCKFSRANQMPHSAKRRTTHWRTFGHSVFAHTKETRIGTPSAWEAQRRWGLAAMCLSIPQESESHSKHLVEINGTSKSKAEEAMMPGLPDDHPSIRYYDGDYPGAETSAMAENLDDKIAVQGLASDIERYKALASRTRGNILEIGCGTGRVLVPLARAGHPITGIDISRAMIERLRQRVGREEENVRKRIRYAIGDIRTVELQRKFGLIIFPFNGLSCLPDFSDQRKAIGRAAAHLAKGGRLVIDLVNPLVLPLKGDDAPKPFLNRRNPDTGNRYTRFAAMGRMRADQTQELFGWYDEIDDRGFVRRTPYQMTWRLVFRYEIQLMIEMAGLTVKAIEGDHHRSPYCETSPKLFVIARK